MKIGFIGLGKMGSQMTKRLLADNHQVTVFDVDDQAVESMAQTGAETNDSRKQLIDGLDPVVVWLMIPSQFVDEELDKLLELAPEGSVLVDGGNSDFRQTTRRYQRCREQGVSWVDVGTSGGVKGLEEGFSMMVGGDDTAVETIRPVLETLAQTNSWHHFGGSGSGHFTKMVHNAIEYGIMESYAEGYRMLQEGPYPDLDLAAAGNVWQHGSIISSFLNELTIEALNQNPDLDGVDGYVDESGETRWALETAKQHNIEMPAVEAAFEVRRESQQGKTNFATKLLAAMRHQFGGHAINKENQDD